MNASEYQKLAMRTNDRKATDRLLELIDDNQIVSGDDLIIPDIGGLLNGCLGLAGESGETLDMVKKWIFHEKELDLEHFKKELGDVMWYMAMICEAMEMNLNEIMQMNVDKLKARYPEGFDTVRANNRADGDM